MSGYLLALTTDPWQVMTLDVVIDGKEFHAQVEIRYLPAPDRWVVSICPDELELIQIVPYRICGRRLVRSP